MANSANIPNLLCFWKLASDHIFLSEGWGFLLVLE